MKKVLITNKYFWQFTGSEIVALELTKWFLENNWEVHLFARQISNPMLEVFEKLNVKITDEEDKLDDDYDLVWIQHFVIPDFLIQLKPEQKLSSSKLSSPQVVFHHMFYKPPNELPILPNLEKSLADVILSNSQETRDEIKKIYDIECEVFGNPAPSEFLRKNSDNKSNNGEIKKITLISNHTPEELKKAIQIIKKNGISVETFGMNEDNFQLITPDIIQSTDLVISIGKSVQYSILSNTPVYCYDHFGGPGFINKENFDTANYYNFSGRGFGKKKASQIAEEITSANYEKIKKDFTEATQEHVKSFDLDYKLNQILTSLKSSKEKTLSEIDIITYQSFSQLLKECLSELNHFKTINNEPTSPENEAGSSLFTKIKNYLKA